MEKQLASPYCFSPDLHDLCDQSQSTDFCSSKVFVRRTKNLRYERFFNTRQSNARVHCASRRNSYTVMPGMQQLGLAFGCEAGGRVDGPRWRIGLARSRGVPDQCIVHRCGQIAKCEPDSDRLATIDTSKANHVGIGFGDPERQLDPRANLVLGQEIFVDPGEARVALADIATDVEQSADGKRLIRPGRVIGAC